MKSDPYVDAPRLPGEGPVVLEELFLPASDGTAGPADPAYELEIGPGRGWFTVERLAFAPEVRMIGFEIRRKWASIVDERLKSRGLGHRGRVFAEDAKLGLRRLPSRSIRVAYLHFPDPWWKKRHEKRLVLGDEVLGELARVLVPGGELFIQTDVFERADEYQARVERAGVFAPVSSEARVDDHPFGARSPRERKAMEDGLPIVRLRYRLAE